MIGDENGNTCKKYQSDPTGRGAHEAGAKLDAGKPMAGLLGDFSLALMEVTKVGTFGANKYSRGGWQSVPEGIQRYDDALMRHKLQSYTEDLDKETGLMHDAAVAWNALARLELRLREGKTLT
jgi:hypothetical protein